MTLTDELYAEVHAGFQSGWSYRQGYVVPQPESLLLAANDVVQLRGTVLYADLVGSTSLVDRHYPWFAAHIYKSFLYCAARIIRSEGGVVTAYDGDRVMAVYRGTGMENAAVRTAFKITFAVQTIINPLQQAKWPEPTKYVMRQVSGVDVSELLVARVGVRNDNDLVWIGRAANHAAKLAALREGEYATYVSSDVYQALDASLRWKGGLEVWERRIWSGFNGASIHRTHWRWSNA